MTDSAWIEAMRALLPGPSPARAWTGALQMFYSESAWERCRSESAYEWQEGDLDRQRTIEHFETVLGVRVPEELREARTNEQTKI